MKGEGLTTPSLVSIRSEDWNPTRPLLPWSCSVFTFVHWNSPVDPFRPKMFVISPQGENICGPGPANHRAENKKRSTWTHFQRNIVTFVDFVKNVQSSSQTETVFPQFKSPVRLKKLQISASTSRVEHLNVLSGPSVKVLNYPGDISLIQEASSGLNFRMFLVDICPQKHNPSTLQWKPKTY